MIGAEMLAVFPPGSLTAACVPVEQLAFTPGGVATFPESAHLAVGGRWVWLVYLMLKFQLLVVIGPAPFSAVDSELIDHPPHSLIPLVSVEALAGIEAIVQWATK